ncbi:MAG: ExbD/TolR family protein [Candidatus Binatia bacterium]
MEFEGRSRLRPELSLAPLIDVVFLLLVFFMLTSTFLVPEAIEVSLPSSERAVARASSELTITIRANGGLLVNGERVRSTELYAKLEDEMRNRGDGAKEATVRADAEVSVQRLLFVLDGVQAAGGRSLYVATRRP